MRRADWRKKIHRERAKALNELHDQVNTFTSMHACMHAALCIACSSMHSMQPQALHAY